MKPAPLVLASGSPRRKEILAELKLDFSVETAMIDETPKKSESPEETARRLASAKAEAVAARRRDSLVIAADSIVTIDNRLIGKPADKEHAREILKSLGGKTHDVITGLAFVRLDENLHKSSTCRSSVTFHELGDEIIETYLSTGEYSDKAGGYAIQGFGKVLVKSYSGSYTNIVGLPVRELLRFIVGYGIRRMPWSAH